MFKILSLLLVVCTFGLNAKGAHIDRFSLATTEIPPYVYIDDNKVVKGLLIDKLHEAQKEFSLKIDIFVMPWARAMSEVKSNRIDAIMPTLWSEERSAFLVYPNRPFYKFDSSVIIKRIDDDFVFTDLGNIGRDKTIGKIRLVMIDKQFDELVEQGKLSIFETTELKQALLMLAQGKLDLVASDGSIARTSIKELGLQSQFTIYPLHKNNLPSYIAFSQAFAKKQDINGIMGKILQSTEDTADQQGH